jgi:hypothetical protein
MIPINTLYFSPAQRATFAKTLSKQWKKRYPFLFDDDDLRIVKKQGVAHFGEWLTAIYLYEATGYHSLVEKWMCDNHPHKRKVMLKYFSKDTLAQLREIYAPDLFCYHPKTKDFFFCEVKVLNDELHDGQLADFPKFERMFSKPVYVASLQLFPGLPTLRTQQALAPNGVPAAAIARLPNAHPSRRSSRSL